MTYMEKYEQWKNDPEMDPSLKNELLAMDEKQIEDAFYTNLEFGTVCLGLEPTA